LGRSKPSSSKLHYLSHLEDFREFSELGLKNALFQLPEIRSEITKTPQVDQGLIEWSNKIENDLKYLSKQLRIRKGDIKSLNSMVNVQTPVQVMQRLIIFTVTGES